MTDFLQRLRQRKLVQWTLAYVAAAFGVIQALDVVADRFAWPAPVMRYLILASAVGFFVIVILTWYHGERGAQRVGGAELLIIALLMAIGGIVVRYAGREILPQPVAVAEARRESTAPVGTAVREPSQGAREARGRSPTVLMPAPIPARSIAVLPFKNLSSDKENDYFVAGMQDLILTRLGDIGDLRVIARRSAAGYQDHPEDLKTIARELGVATVLEGSVQKHGRQVLINVRLVDTRTAAHLWAQTYKRELDDIFGVEGEVAQTVARELDARLDAAQSARLAIVPTTNPPAYDLFLRAEHEPSFRRAAPLYRQAIAQDPNFALAYARLSRRATSVARSGGAGDSPRQLYAQAHTDAEQALKLAPNLAASHLALGFNLYYSKGDYAGALAAFGAALTLHPNDAGALAARGLIERAQGRFDTAIDSLMQALLRDPRNAWLAYTIGHTHMMIRHYAQAKAWMQRALALYPGGVAARWGYSRAILLEDGDVVRSLATAAGNEAAMMNHRIDLMLYQRKIPEAITLMENIADIYPSQHGTKTAMLAWLYWFAGDQRRARKLFARALKRDRAALKHVQGVALGGVWNSVAFDEIGLGNIAEGLAAVAKAEAIVDETKNAVIEPVQRRVDAQAYAFAGRADLAVPVLAKALAAPGGGADYSPPLLWLDPAWDPIRDDPRFRALLEQYARYKPKVTYEQAQETTKEATGTTGSGLPS